MFYIKLDSGMNLVVTAREAIYRGDRLNQKLTFLVPLQVGDIDIGAAALYLSYIRADGTADIDLLTRDKELYNESYYKFTMPVTSRLTRYAGPVTAFLTIYSGPFNNPIIAKSGECMLHVQASTNMDDVVTDHNLSLIYSMQKQMEDKVEEAEEALGSRIDETNAALEEGLAKKADNVVFDGESGTLQLMSGDEPIGNAILIQFKDEAVGITDAVINDDGELVLTLSDGTVQNLGNVVGTNGSVYVPHIDAHKVLTFTIDTEPSEPPAPIDLAPADDWSSIDGSEVKTDYVWESI